MAHTLLSADIVFHLDTHILEFPSHTDQRLYKSLQFQSKINPLKNPSPNEIQNLRYPCRLEIEAL